VILQLYTLPLPTACALGGHATAGGAILALTGDFRIAAEGRTLFGFNEVNIGVPVPYLADLILRQLVGDRIATHMLFFGQFMESEPARQAGIVDEVAVRDMVESRAIEKIEKLASMPQPAFGMIKQNRIGAVHTAFLNNRDAKKEAFLICWFQEAVQALLKQAAEKF
jgi:enoyl-CoA hydratase/carnithine racemase